MARRISRSRRSRPGGVDLEQVERLARHARVDVAGAAHLGEVAHALEEAVRHARRAARAAGDRLGARRSSISTSRMPAERQDDAGEVGRLVELEAVGHAEAVAQRGGEQAGAGGGADQREVGQVER